MASFRFSVGRVSKSEYSSTALALACLVAAAVSFALDVVHFERPDLLPTGGLRTLAETAAVVIPIYLVVRKRAHGWWLLTVLGTAYVFSLTAYEFERVLVRTVQALRGSGTPLEDAPWFYLVAAAAMAPVLFFAIEGLYDATARLTWQLRLWTTQGARRALVPFTDSGAAWIVAAPPAWIAMVMLPLLSGYTRLSGNTLSLGWLLDLLGAFAVILLTIPHLVKLLRLGRSLPKMPAGLPVADQQEWVSRHAGVECVPPNSGEGMTVTPGLWWGHPLLLARANASDDSGWVACSGLVRWDKTARYVTVSAFCNVRPDLGQLLGLPPGWVITTDPPQARHAPDIAAKVLAVVSECKIART
jgi:hypothetical protein